MAARSPVPTMAGADPTTREPKARAPERERLRGTARPLGAGPRGVRSPARPAQFRRDQREKHAHGPALGTEAPAASALGIRPGSDAAAFPTFPLDRPRGQEAGGVGPDPPCVATLPDAYRTAGRRGTGQGSSSGAQEKSRSRAASGQGIGLDGQAIFPSREGIYAAGCCRHPTHRRRGSRRRHIRSKGGLRTCRHGQVRHGHKPRPPRCPADR